ncbi:MbtH family protein [Streptomyces sp. NPDC017520]|uniref:MbtH family protein n=1 Tax=Streptomyces sp. NPDC017520 TaxID=3364998 RepID=UPI0037956580
MANPFDDEKGTFVVLINGEGQYSLWPEDILIPAGWETSYGPSGRSQCLDFVNTNWTDMRPRSLSARATE